MAKWTVLARGWIAAFKPITGGHPTPAAPTTNPVESADLPLDIAQQKLDRQLSSVDAIDAKLSSVFTWSGGLLALAAAVVALRADRLHSAAVDVLLAVALVVYLAVTRLALVGLAAQSWGSGPTPEQIITDYGLGTAEADAKWRVTRAFLRSIDHNAPMLARKADVFTRSLWLLAAETAAVVISLILVAR